MGDERSRSVPHTRSATFYRATLSIAAIGAGYVVMSGRFAAYFRVFADWPRATPPDAGAFEQALTTSLIWLAASAPLFYSSWELGRQHTGARRLGYDLLIGLLSVFRIAVFGKLTPVEAQAFERAPSDDPRRAASCAVLSGLAVPVFFLTAPPLRTPQGAFFLGVAGALIGTAEYFRRRSLPYLRDEPRGLFGAHRLYDPERYAPPGARFVKLQLVATLALAVWWLGGGMLLLAPR